MELNIFFKIIYISVRIRFISTPGMIIFVRRFRMLIMKKILNHPHRPPPFFVIICLKKRTKECISLPSIFLKLLKEQPAVFFTELNCLSAYLLCFITFRRGKKGNFFLVTTRKKIVFLGYHYYYFFGK